MPPTSDPKASDADRRHLRGAMCLAGYAVECLLKAYIIGMTGTQTLPSAMDELNRRRAEKGLPPVENIARSIAGHNIGYLLQVSDLADYDQRLWGRVAVWSSEWRYDITSVTRKNAHEFVDDIGAAINYLSPRVGV